MPSVHQASISALNVARCRAIAAHETRDDIRGHDTLAEVFLDEPARQSLKNPAIHPVILKKLTEVSPGGYEYFIARTAYLDDIVEQALIDHMPQLVFLGAGYDTRACRFRHLLDVTTVFELDEPTTQTHKRGLLDQANIQSPAQLVYVPIDFTHDDLLDRLTESGYAPDKQTLFIWEGVTYYLPPRTVEEVLHFIRSNSPVGSQVCFDYMLPASQLEGRFGAMQSRAAMQAMYTEEPLLFDLDEALITDFLAEHGFELIEHVSAEEMQERYLTLEDGTSAGQILDLFRLALAQVIE